MSFSALILVELIAISLEKQERVEQEVDYPKAVGQ